MANKETNLAKKLLVLLTSLCLPSFAFALTGNEGQAENSPAPCTTCTQNQDNNTCQDSLDDPDSPYPTELGEGPTGY